MLTAANAMWVTELARGNRGVAKTRGQASPGDWPGLALHELRDIRRPNTRRVSSQREQRNPARLTFDRDPRFVIELGPGQTTRGTWRYPLQPDDQRKVRVEADDLSGRRVFCREFSYDDLRALSSRIEIVRGELACP